MSFAPAQRLCRRRASGAMPQQRLSTGGLEMRKISAGMFMSLDGVVEQPSFVFPYFTDDVGAAIGQIMDRSDTILMGRKLYEEWSAYWPGKTAADDPFAEIINNRPKLVLSNTLKLADWASTTILSGDVK